MSFFYLKFILSHVLLYFFETNYANQTDRLLKAFRPPEHPDLTKLQHSNIEDKSKAISAIAVIDSAYATRHWTHFVTVLDFAHFPVPTRLAFHFSRLRHWASGPESKPRRREDEEKRNLARARECRGPLTASCLRNRPRPYACLCACIIMQVRADAMPLALVLLCAKAVYYNMPRHGYTRDAHTARPGRARVYVGNERIIFQRVRAMNGRFVVLVLRTQARLRVALRHSSPSRH